MNDQYRSPLLITLFGCLVILFTSCLPNNEEIERAFVNLHVQFTDSGNMMPINDTRIDIFAQFSTSQSSFFQGPAVTNDNGFIDGFLDNPDEATLTKLSFAFTANGEEFTVEEDVNAQFRYEEPYEEIDLLFEVAVTEAEE